ncbi:MAG: hypothetical protein LUC18_02695 [Porphyromonadaceae bacterium]|nr:hypothetical protein [Porphyromonadaceae bacterium]
MKTNVEKKLRANVIDEDAQYTPRQVAWARVGLVLGLWGPFVLSVVILYISVRIAPLAQYFTGE